MERVGALAITAVAIVGCGDNGVVPIDMAPPIDEAPPAPAQLTITAGTNFGSVTVGESSTEMTFTVGNTGEGTSGTVSASIIGSGSTQFTIESNDCGTVAPGATCVIAVSFTPTSAGAKSASLTVTADPGSTASASLDGTGRPPGQLSISPQGNQNLGSSPVGTASATTATFTVTNTGAVATTAVAVTAGGSNPGDFAKSDDTCNAVLQPAGTCSFTITFTPTATGSRAALFDVAAQVGGTVNAAVSGTGLAPAQLEITPALQPFGTVVVGQSSTDISFIVRNIGEVATSAVTHDITGDGGDFPLVSSDCNSTLAPNATCTIVRNFTPTAVGSRNATITVTATTGGSDTASLVGTGQDVGTISIAPSPYVFTPAQTVGTASLAQVFTVTNNGGSMSGPLTTALGGADAAQFTIPAASNACAGANLNVGQMCTIAVQFAPTTAGNKSAVLSVTGVNVATAGISGTAIDAADLEIDPATQDFGSIGTGTTTNFVTFTIRNVGGQPTAAAPQIVLGGANATQFETANNLCTAPLQPLGQPGNSCTVQARFAPTINGDFTATITASAAGTTDVSQLFGEGVNPAQLQPGGTPPTTFLTFPLTLIGDTSAQQVFTVVNNGTETTGTLAVTTTGANAAEFNVSDTCNGQTLAAGFSCTVTVTFEPTDRGLRNASINVAASPGGSFNVALSGTADSRLRLTGTVNDGLTLAGGSQDFDSVIINTSNPPTATLTFVNNVVGAVGSTSTITTAANGFSGQYSISSNGCTGTIANNGGTCQMIVTFLPTTVGTKDATITVGINGGGANNTQVVSLTGEGVNSLVIRPLDGSPPSGNFGNVAVGTASAIRRFEVENPANSPESGNITTVLTGAAYQIVYNTCAEVAGPNNTLAGGESCEIGVIFLPTSNTTFTGSIVASATPGGSVTQDLTGAGTGQADITITPPADFGAVFAGSASVPQTITIENIGGVPTTLGSVTGFAGANAGQFARTGGSCALTGEVLNAGESCTVIVTFTPGNLTAPLTRSATLTVNATPSATGAKTVTFTGTARSTIVIDNNGAFGPVTIGTSPAETRVLTVTNESPSAVNVTSSNPGGAFNIVANTCGAGLAANGGECFITVSYNPSGTTAQTANLVVTATNGSATAVLSGTPVSVTTLVLVEQNSCGFSPPMTCTNRDFGTAFENTLGSIETFTFRNSGGQTSGPLTVSLAGTNPGDYDVVSMGCQGQTLALNATCTVVIQFAPALGATGDRTANLVVAPSSGPGAPVTAALTGRRIAAGGVTVTPATAVFEANTFALNVPSNVQNFVVQNTGSGTENLNMKFCNFNDGTCPSSQFTLLPGASNPCGGTLASGQSCNVQVQFTPQNDDQFVGFTITRYLIVQGGACTTAGSCAGQPYAALRGRVLSRPNVSISQTNFDFGSRAVTTDTAFTLTLTNSGDTASGVVSTGPLLAPNANQFTISADTCDGNTIAPNSSCSMTLRFLPTQTGPQASSFNLSIGNLSDGDNGGFSPTPRLIMLGGTGLNQASISITPSAPPTNAGSAPVGSVTGAPMLFTISNIAGSATTSPLNFSLTNEADYDLLAPIAGDCVNGVTTLAATMSCTIRVSFRPVSASPATRTTRLNVNASTGGAAFSDITGQATNPLTASPSPATLGTGTAEVTITFTNSVGAGGASIGLLGSTIGGASAARVSIVEDLCAGVTLTAGASCDVTVRRIPGGTFTSATLTVAGAIDGTGSTATTPVTLTP